jgi:glycosyltransferase involved in cell wall biosynthesis
LNILIIHNRYGHFSGEEAVVENQVRLLAENGHHVTLFTRSSDEIPGLKLKQVTAFFSGLRNTHSIRMLKEHLAARKFDIAHIHNLYPLISPAILPVLSSHRIPVVMTVHNYRLVCPNGLFFTHGNICEKCSGGREWHCITNNCEKTLFKSSGYALRNWYARINRFYNDNVSLYLCLTGFQRDKLIANGFSEEKTVVLPNSLNVVPSPVTGPTGHSYIAFAGRISREKGAHVVMDTARTLPGVPFKLAGSPDKSFISKLSVPSNVEFTGSLNNEEIRSFYRNASALVVPSIWYEGFPMVTLEAMQHSLPIIAPDLGGFPEIVEDGVNGLLFNPGDADDLAAKIRILWNDDELCSKLGENGFIKLQTQYSPEVYYQKLMDVYASLLA